MKKKFLVIMLAAVVGMTMYGCQSKKADEPFMESTMTEQGTEEETTEMASEVEEKDETEEEQQGGIRVEEATEETEDAEGIEETTEEITEEEEQDPDYMGDMYDPWASEYVDDVDLNYVENLSDEEDGIISTQLNAAEDYGHIEEKDFSFVNELDETVYYYEMELFHFDEGTVPKNVITCLEAYHERKEAEYQKYGEEMLDEEWKHRLAIENGEIEPDEEGPEGNGMYDKCFFQYIPYIGEDYVSIVYYEINCMGGAEYGTLEAVTIDCKTGEEVTAAEILGITNDAELRCEISDKMGVEGILTWDELDYYITDKVIVFLGKPYWMQGNYEDVVVYR